MGRVRHSNVQQMSREHVVEELRALALGMKSAAAHYRSELEALHPNFKRSGENLLHYLVLRSSEIRDTQSWLHQAGLSSLTNSESHTLSQVENIIGWLTTNGEQPTSNALTAADASRLQTAHNEGLLGVFPSQDRPQIMVTFSTELLHDRKQIEEMLSEGMSVARINCAHDDPSVWREMISVLRKAEAKTGKSCKIYMDLAGPKIRIKTIQPKKQKNSEGLEVREGKQLILQYAEEGPNRLPLMKNKDVLLVEPRELLSAVRSGEHIFFDDGKFEAKVIEKQEGQVLVEIVRISTKNPTLRPEKGINLPDTDLAIEPLTESDRKNLPFICQYADMVGFSFVNSPDDVEKLRKEMNRYSAKKRPAIVLKIERLSAIQNLPALLMNGMKDEALGVMIARGDLAVEIGFERLSEIQEEILWICESAHVPVIWATQVLETLNKTGYATRSEITDAAMSGRAECVMLNKGKYTVKTIKTLDDILTRQAGHVNKKHYIMRPLGIARSFIQASEQQVMLPQTV